MTEAENDPSPKIIVDSDWKEQVQKEKVKAAAGENGDESVPEAAEESNASSKDSDVASGPIPPANFETLISMLFTQAMSFLGQIPDPESGEPKIDKSLARHTIDTLDMLNEKTAGNLSESESKMLQEALHALRLTFVNVR